MPDCAYLSLSLSTVKKTSLIAARMLFRSPFTFFFSFSFLLANEQPFIGSVGAYYRVMVPGRASTHVYRYATRFRFRCRWWILRTCQRCRGYRSVLDADKERKELTRDVNFRVWSRKIYIYIHTYFFAYSSFFPPIALSKIFFWVKYPKKSILFRFIFFWLGWSFNSNYMACNGKIISLKSRELSNNFLFISLVNRGHKGSINR